MIYLPLKSRIQMMVEKVTETGIGRLLKMTYYTTTMVFNYNFFDFIVVFHKKKRKIQRAQMKREHCFRSSFETVDVSIIF